jgi:hypothetical protein
MRKGYKRILSLLLSLVMILGMVPTNVFAANDGMAEVSIVIENTTFPESEGAPWEGRVYEGTVIVPDGSTIRAAIDEAAKEAGIELDGADNYISGIDGLTAQHQGSNSGSGWMITQNDWMINKGVNEIIVEDRDEVSVMYTNSSTDNIGADLGGVYGDNTKTLDALDVEGAELSPGFDPDTKEYTLTLAEGADSIKVTPTAANKNFMVKIFAGEQEYKRADQVPAEPGTEIKVECGNPAWPTMNNGSESVPSEVYTLTIPGEEQTAEAPTIKQAAFVGENENYQNLVLYGYGTMSVTASVTDGGILSYQWYRSETEDGEYTPVEGADTNRLRAAGFMGTSYYFCRVTNTLEGAESYTDTGIGKVTVTQGAEFSIMSSTSIELKLFEEDGVTEVPLTYKGYNAAGNQQVYTSDTEIPQGNYIIKGFADGQPAGSYTITMDGNTASYSLFRQYLKTEDLGEDINAGTDYTVEVTRENGDPMDFSALLDVGGKKYYSGIGEAMETYKVTLLPGETLQEKGYGQNTISVKQNGYPTAPVDYALNVNFGRTVRITVPEQASLFVGTKTAHYIPFTEVKPTGDPVTEAGLTTYSFGLEDQGIYNLRVSMAGKVTYADKFKASVGQHFTFEESDLADDPQQIGSDLATIYMNINKANYLKLGVGETFDIFAFRVYQIIDTTTTNYFMEPDFHYTVLEGEDVVEITDQTNGTVKGLKEGTAVIAVTYDALESFVSGKAGDDLAKEKTIYSALKPENCGIIAVTVGENGEVNTGIDLDADFESVYWADTINKEPTGKKSADYTFVPEEGSTVSVRNPVLGTNSVTGFTDGKAVDNRDGSWTVELTYGRNIVKVEKDGAASYCVVTARPMDLDITPAAEGDDTINAGEYVNIAFGNMMAPIQKMGGVYNPFSSNIYYTDEIGTKYKSTSVQYSDLGRGFTAYIPSGNTSDTFLLTNGVFEMGYYGAASGRTHRDLDRQTGIGPSIGGAPTIIEDYSVLADIVVPLTASERVTITFDVPQGVEVTVTDSEGFQVEPQADGTYSLIEGKEYTYSTKSDNYTNVENVTFTADSDKTITPDIEPAEKWDGAAVSEPAVIENVYQISSGAELAWLAQQVNEGTGTAYAAVLTANIHMNYHNWTPIGTAEHPYDGTFDGKGFAVYDFSIEAEAERQGLFGTTGQNSSISNLTMYGKIQNNGNYTGAVAGYSQGTITNCHNYVKIPAAYSYTGGIAGYSSGTIQQCSNHADILRYSETNLTAPLNNGGIVGQTAGTVSNCYNTGDLSGYMSIGGIAGMGSGVISNCYNTGSITVKYTIYVVSTAKYGAGIVANFTNGSSITNCYNMGKIDCSGWQVRHDGVVGAAGRNTEKSGLYCLEGTASTTTNETVVSEDGLKNLALSLGTGFAPDYYGINNGYPALAWQTEGLVDSYDVSDGSITDGIFQAGSNESVPYFVIKAGLLDMLSEQSLGLQVVTSSVTLNLDAEAVSRLNSKTDDDVTFHMGQVLSSTENEIQKILDAGGFVYDFALTDGTGSRLMTDADNGSILFKIPYSLGNGYDASEIKAFSLGEDNKTLLESTYADGAVTITSDRFGTISLEYGSLKVWTEEANHTEFFIFGETAYIDVYAGADNDMEYKEFSLTVQNSPEKSYTSVLVYDADKSELGDGVTATPAEDGKSLKLGYSGEAKTISKDGTRLARLAFTVNTTSGTLTVPVSGASFTTLSGAEQKAAAEKEASLLVRYVTIAFRQGTGSTMTAVIFYARYGEPGMYLDQACTQKATIEDVPVPKVNSGYRLAADTEEEPGWSIGADKCTTEQLFDESRIFTSSVSVMPVTYQQMTVNFYDSEANLLEGSGVTDRGTCVNAPVPPSLPGRDFAGWFMIAYSNGNAAYNGTAQLYTSDEIAQRPVTSNTGYKTYYTNASYQVQTGYAIEAVSGIEEGMAVYGTDVTFTCTGAGRAYYTVDNGTKVYAGEKDGVYTIPGTEITGELKIAMEGTMAARLAYDYYKAGDTITVEMTARNAQFNAAGFVLKYDADMLAFTGQELSDGFSSAYGEVDKNAGTVASSMYRTDGVNVTADEAGTVVETITFAVLKAGMVKFEYVTIPGNQDFSEEAVVFAADGEPVSAVGTVEYAATQEADQQAAEAVDQQIAAIGKITPDSEEVIAKAREAYEALGETQKALITKLDVLETAERAYDLWSRGDVNWSGLINISDLSKLLGRYGTQDKDCDVNKDSIVNAADLSKLLANYGARGK